MTAGLEPDGVDPRFVLGVAAVSVAVTALCCGLAWLVLMWSSAEHESRAFHQTRSQRPPAEINHIEANLLDGSSPRPDTAVANRRLESFGWSDREQGLVHVPLERAFELYQHGSRVAGAREEGRKEP